MFLQYFDGKLLTSATYRLVLLISNFDSIRISNVKIRSKSGDVRFYYSCMIGVSAMSVYTVSQKTTMTLHTITSMHINRFR